MLNPTAKQLFTSSNERPNKTLNSRSNKMPNKTPNNRFNNSLKEPNNRTSFKSFIDINTFIHLCIKAIKDIKPIMPFINPPNKNIRSNNGKETADLHLSNLRFPISYGRL